MSNLSANTKTANISVTLQAPTESDTSISINTHQEASFLVEDILKVQSNFDLMSEYTSKSGFAIAEAIDTNLDKNGFFYRNVDVKTREFGENPERTIPSRAQKWEGVTTMYVSPKGRRDSLN